MTPPPDRYCDLVMKGGITSGIVYPKAVALLAKHYRFKSIGGTSAGAIAAVATAAAEYRRRNSETGDMEGFEELGRLPDDLASNGKLFSLFQPAYGCRRLFQVLETALNAKGKWERAGRIVLGLMLGYATATLVSLLLAIMAKIVTDSWLAAILTFVVAWLVLTAVGILINFIGPVVNNNYGLCTGMPGSRTVRQRISDWLGKRKPPEALMPWLHELVQRLAGRNSTEKPLTFGDLWTAPGYPQDWIKLAKGTQIRSIELKMFTTNVSHGRPYILPFEEEIKQFFYHPDELKAYVSKPVMDWLDDKWNELNPKPALPALGVEGLRPLPKPEDFPIVLAARMSLSFPLLFSAVPLWVEDDVMIELQDGKQKKMAKKMSRCLFSDGGISSNFPVHLFDGLLPMWPTFGIQLEPAAPGTDETDLDALVRLPKAYNEGYEERWNRFEEGRKGGFSKFAGFMYSVVGTMQNWNDNALARMPGVRDRVVRVGLFDNEGGLNLNMEKKIIDKLVNRGEVAVDRLVEGYSAPEDALRPYGESWDRQRWIRLGVALTMLRKRFAGAQVALNSPNPFATPFDELVKRGGNRSMSDNTTVTASCQYLDGLNEYLTDEQIGALLHVLNAMARDELYKPLVSETPEGPFHAIPVPDLRIRPSL
jgi:predicted acylesterase/phospholipase RssA